MQAPTLIIAIGNESRGDDALGPLLLRELDSWLRNSEKKFIEQFELIEEFQLQIENAMDIKDRKRVLFIDAGMDTPCPFHFYRLNASELPVLYSHALPPETLLKVYTQFYHEAPPEAFVLCIKGEAFELGEPLSGNAIENLALALGFVKRHLLTAESAAWNTTVSQAPGSEQL